MQAFLVALRYPNGRIHETVYDAEQPMERGTELEMYGHTWRVVGFQEKYHRSGFPHARPQRFLCNAVEEPSPIGVNGGDPGGVQRLRQTVRR